MALGVCGPGQCPQFPTLWSDTRSAATIRTQETFSFDPATFRCRPRPASPSCLMATRSSRSATSTCRPTARPNPIPSPTTFDASFSASTDKALEHEQCRQRVASRRVAVPGARRALHRARTPSMCRVICDPVIKPPTNDIAHDFGEFDVDDVKLFLTTYQNKPARLEPRHGLPVAQGDQPRPGQPGRTGDDAHLAAEGRRPDHLGSASRPGPPSTPPRTAISPPTRNGRMSARPPTTSSGPRSSTTASFRPPTAGRTSPSTAPAPAAAALRRSPTTMTTCRSRRPSGRAR